MSAGSDPQSDKARLNSSYTFEEFVVGPHNRFPHAAAQAVSENLGKAYNPLFIYGPVGMGKTHLMHAVGHRVLAKKESANVLYVTAEQFMMEVIELLQAGDLQSMREKYRSLDILLVDDIQFLATSESTQEEFFHTFNELHHEGKQIIMTSDRPPKMLTTLEDRLRSRFEWGLIADIKQTNLETRVAILRKKENHLNGLQLGDDIRLYIAGSLKSNVRELEGFLRRVQAYAQLNNQEVTLPLVKEIMRELLPPQDWSEEDQEANASAKAAAPTNDPVLPPPMIKPPAGSEPKQKQKTPPPPKPAAPPPPPQTPAMPPPPPETKAPDKDIVASLADSLQDLGASLGLGTESSIPSSTPQPPPEPPKAAPPPPPPAQEPPPPPPPVPQEIAPPAPPTPEPEVPEPVESLDLGITNNESPAPTETKFNPAPSAGSISAAFFYPQGKSRELGHIKKKFGDIIKKHKLKFQLHAAIEIPYALDDSLSYNAFVDKLEEGDLMVAIILGPPPEGRLQETIFHQRLQDLFDMKNLSLQMILWDELEKDYRYLNLALDITLIRFNKQKK